MNNVKIKHFGILFMIPGSHDAGSQTFVLRFIPDSLFFYSFEINTDGLVRTR